MASMVSVLLRTSIIRKLSDIIGMCQCGPVLAMAEKDSPYPSTYPVNLLISLTLLTVWQAWGNGCCQESEDCWQAAVSEYFPII